VSKEQLLGANLPMLPAEFKAFVKERCREVHEELRKKSVMVFCVNYFYWRVPSFTGRKY